MKKLASMLLLSFSLMVSTLSPCGNKDSLESLFSQLDKLLLDCSYENYDCNTAVREISFTRDIASIFYDSCRDCKKDIRKKYSHLIHLIRDHYIHNID